MVYIFPKSICPKVNAIARLEFELTMISQSSRLATDPAFYLNQLSMCNKKSYNIFFIKNKNKKIKYRLSHLKEEREYSRDNINIYRLYILTVI